MKTITFNKQSITPSKIVCAGRNYSEHIEELNNAVPDDIVFFFKANSAITNTLNAKHNGDQIHYETELCFLIENQKLTGVAVGLDLTKRDVQHDLKTKGLPWERAKTFDGSALFSAFIDLPKNINEQTNFIENLSLELQINNKVTQAGSVSQMINRPQAILDNASSFVSFNNGDILMTGTPKGVGKVNADDTFRALLKNGKGETLCQQQWIAS